MGGTDMSLDVEDGVVSEEAAESCTGIEIWVELEAVEARIENHLAVGGEESLPDDIAKYQVLGLDEGN